MVVCFNISMPYISNSERRSRHLCIDRSIEAYKSVLDQNDADNGHIDPEVSKSFKEILDSLVIPNNRNGTLSLGKNALLQEDFIPVWAAAPEEEFNVSPNLYAPTDRQKKLALNALTRFGITLPKGTDPFQDTFKTGYSFCLESSSSAMVVGDYGWYREDNENIAVKSRPLLVLAMDKPSGKQVPAASPAVLHHEVTHLFQDLEDPAHPLNSADEQDDKHIAEEIQAYLHFGDIVKEMGRQNYTPRPNEMRPTFRPYSLALAMYALRLQFDYPHPPFYKVRPDSRIVAYIRNSNMLPILTDNLDQDETTETI